MNSMVTMLVSAYGFFNFMQYLDGGKTYKFILCVIIVIFNFIISIKARNIKAIEKMHQTKRSLIITTLLYIFLLYILRDNILNKSIIKSVGLFVAIYIICLIISMIIRDLLFTYIILWVNYFFGEKYIYENKNFEIRINRTPKGCKYYYLYLDGFELELSEKAANLYCKDSKGVKLTGNMLIKKSPILKNIIVLDIWR